VYDTAQTGPTVLRIGDSVILAGGTKATLGKLPEFKFATK
jgi:hypothetical protein